MLYGDMKKYSVTFDPASVNGNTTSEQDVTVTEVGANDVCIGVDFPAAMNAGLGVVGFRVKQANTITVRIANATAGALNYGSGTWVFNVVTYDGVGNYL